MGLTLATRILIFIIGVPVGFFCLLKSLWVVNTIGKNGWAEANFPGGTYGVIKIAGIVIIVVSIILLLGI